MTTFHHTLWIIYLLIFLGGDSVVVRLFWFLCGNEIYTDSFFSKIALKAEGVTTSLKCGEGVGCRG